MRAYCFLVQRWLYSLQGNVEHKKCLGRLSVVVLNTEGNGDMKELKVDGKYIRIWSAVVLLTPVALLADGWSRWKKYGK